MWTWIAIIINIIGLVLSVMIIDRGITDSCQNDTILGLVLLFVNLFCLVFNIYIKENNIKDLIITKE